MMDCRFKPVDKVEQSLRIIKLLYSNEKENICAFSGGKDSIVLYDLCKKSGLKFTYIYTNTTIDPPGHIKFIRENYPDVIIQQPKLSFYQLVAKKGLPIRSARWCCAYLKEYIGKNCKSFEGIRMEESNNRRIRLEQLKEPESCDRRVKSKIHVYPIMYWLESEIWEYIKKNNLPYPVQYDHGKTRLGCVGCMMTTQKNRIRDFKEHPRYVYATIKAIKKNIDSGKGLCTHFNDPYDAFLWWISDKTVKNYKRKQLININPKETIEQMFPLKRKENGTKTNTES